ncbi:hypothetical protein LSH36_488g00005 [Paralvinella palmiformis]|uniref:Uncharacterized protein n=1 Tax=Paralvinella palmiformis TaxID=53620 RepID=A0AAD9J9I1_9ANNE|nr:hypothetical protein LSH36_488g00005 [Paralvinella palmiformis]
MDTLKIKVDMALNSIAELETRFTDLENGVEYIEREYDEQKPELAEVKSIMATSENVLELKQKIVEREEIWKDDKALKSRMKELRRSGKMAFIRWSMPSRLLYRDKDKPTDPLRTITMEECVKLLLEHKADPNVKDNFGETSLHYAARDGAINLLRVLLKSNKIFVDVKNKEGLTPLHIASKNRNLKVTDILLQHGADINAPNNKGYTVLMEAAQDGATDVVRYILEHGADVKREDESGDYSEIDASKMSEAAGGLDTWNDNTDDESEIQLEQKVC